MPRKSIPPSEPLPADLQERLEVFKTYTVEHAMLIRKDDKLTQKIWEPGGFAFLLLSGPKVSANRSFYVSFPTECKPVRRSSL